MTGKHINFMRKVHLKNPLDRDNGTFNSSNTDVNCLVAASKHGGTSVAEGSPLHVDRNGFVLVTFHGGSFLGDFLKTKF